ncbi:E3 ubiquitin-protein ligase MSL2-like isoform X2 [Aphis gossypii]|uniref:E3 ubiquitin-protein ligase MSL2-like isoform X2 n=1 Tax=Aphis gossypii TaxID=80765 RepID=UPI00215970AE|nr:E3 ubiquitin-protein ligase MSL2-like isoform X2 [Aphis gossypii]
MDSNLLQCYVSANLIVSKAKSTDPSTWQNLHTLLLQLHERLSCKVCHKLIDRLNPYLDGYACSTCVNHQITENASSTIIQCYKKLCAYIHSTPVYKVMCTRVEDKQLVELLMVVNNPSLSINGYNGLSNGLVNKQKTEEVDNEDKTLISSSNVQLPIENQTSKNNISLQIFDEQSQNHKIQDQTEFNNNPKKKKNERRSGCRCGNTVKNAPVKLTCIGQRCRCYAVQKPCEECSCKGCRNPRPKRSNNDGNLEIDKIRRKPVTLDLISSLQPSHIESNPVILKNLPSHSQNYDQGETEVTLGHVNSIFHSP